MADKTRQQSLYSYRWYVRVHNVDDLEMARAIRRSGGIQHDDAAAIFEVRVKYTAKLNIIKMNPKKKSRCTCTDRHLHDIRLCLIFFSLFCFLSLSNEKKLECGISHLVWNFSLSMTTQKDTLFHFDVIVCFCSVIISNKGKKMFLTILDLTLNFLGKTNLPVTCTRRQPGKQSCECNVTSL